MSNNWKKREGIVYSTNQNFEYEINKKEIIETLPPEKQKLKIRIDKKQRNGKIVTIVAGFVGSENDLNDLSKKLKTKCGCGGSVKNGEIIIQGNMSEKIKTILLDEKYRL